MSTLWNQTKSRQVLSDLRVANSAWSRLKGLLGTKSLESQSGLWIHACNSIHTFFMQYPIDCVFLDNEMMIRSVVENVQPGRVVWPQWGAVSVIEIKGGHARELGLQVGDRLNVGD